MKKINTITNSKTTPYSVLRGDILQIINGFKKIIATKTKPTKKDYERGHYLRYFCKRNNSNNIYYEIDKKTYKDLIAENSKYDHNLYTPGNLRWAIEGDVIKTNKNILLNKENTFPNISTFFVKLNEFQNLEKIEKTIHPPSPNFIVKDRLIKKSSYIAPKSVQQNTTPTGGGGY